MLCCQLMVLQDFKVILKRPKRLSGLIAGVQKAGTTALHSFLSAHPELFLPPTKELHFSGHEKMDWDRPQYETYDKHFAARKQEQDAGEATSVYTYWQSVPARIARITLR